MTLERLQNAFVATSLDLAPVVLVVLIFQVLVLWQGLPRARMILIGLAHVVAGLSLFRLGLELSLLPVGSVMAEQLATLGGAAGVRGLPSWAGYVWLYVFAAAIGFAATMVEPTLIAVADRARDLTGGALRPMILRVVVAAGVALGLATGSARIVTGVPLEHLIASMLVLTLLLSMAAPRPILALAFDTGPMATSVVTVPLIAALGVGIAAAVPGRTPLDGFGLVVLALLAPVISVLALASLQALLDRMRSGGERT
jgi:hypothetical protein